MQNITSPRDLYFLEAGAETSLIAGTDNQSANPSERKVGSHRPIARRESAERFEGRIAAHATNRTLPTRQHSLGLRRRDLCAAEKCRVLIHDQSWCFDVTAQRATGL